MTTKRKTPNTSMDIGGNVEDSNVVIGNGNVQSTDIIARDKVIQNFQYVNLDIEKIINVLKNALPKDDLTPQYLLNTLKSFQQYHALLHEWKELHNFLNDILIMFGPFTSEIDRMEISNTQPNIRQLRSLWRPVSQKVIILLEWGKGIQYIGAPFIQSQQSLQGPSWAVELCNAQERINQLLTSSDIIVRDEVIDARGGFYDRTQMHLYLADKELRAAASEIYNLSRIVLGSLTHE